MNTSGLVRRLFVVPLADNDHGKSSVLKALSNQARRRAQKVPKRGRKEFVSPWGRRFDTLFSPRSYQETLKAKYNTVGKALAAIDKTWYECELVIFPSHLHREDCKETIGAAHSYGFDSVSVPVFMSSEEITQYHECLSLDWDERWTLFNPNSAKPARQVRALGCDLWTWIAMALTRQ